MHVWLPAWLPVSVPCRLGTPPEIGYPIEVVRFRRPAAGADARSVRPTTPTFRRAIPRGEHDEEIHVAANCDVCGKGPGFGHSISHSHRRTKRRWNPNIQRVRAVVAGAPKRVYVCTSCLKAGKVQRTA